MMVTIQQALKSKAANQDELAAILNSLGADGYTADQPADEVFALLNAEDYKDDLNKRHCNLIRAAQGAKGGAAGVLQVCML